MKKSFIISLSIFFGVVLVYFVLTLFGTDFSYTYLLDDAYIHLAVAKNFAFHGIWGVTEYGFSSTSSSPLFTWLLSWCLRIFGNFSILSFIFNCMAAVFVVYYLNLYYNAFLNNKKQVIAATLFTLFFAVMHLQVLMGMEHVLQVLFFVMNVFYFQKWFRGDFKDQNSKLGFFITLCFLGLIRFEAMFYFVSLAAGFCMLKRWNYAVLVLILGFLPIVIFGYFNYLQDGYFFPNSVEVKGNSINFSGNYLYQIKNLIFTKFLLNASFYKIAAPVLAIVALLICRDYKKGKTRKEILQENFLILVFSSTLLLHNAFGTLKSIFRYEAYLLVVFCMVLIPKMTAVFTPSHLWKKDKLLFVLVVINFLLLMYKNAYSHIIIIEGSKNVYTQQVQSAKFLQKYYNRSKVVANDIGAVTYFTHIHLLDIAGLGSKEMIEFNRNGRLFGDDFEKYLTEYCNKNKYDIAIVYEEWLNGHVPANWKKVAVLNIDNTVNARGNVAVYAINPAEISLLKSNIQNFNWDKRVRVEIIK